ncbi:dTDP-glucose 4,6-dehydratase [Parafrankia irregularis]|uniref:dTDP-glucose 4,6-dehydratase n=1 Tax=Parafrankia irregularis TaxID=795642 RepID=A0A0S4QF46_9ACTN|nr:MULTISPECIES: UDP-glucuronic acid decarboxylase family protein [Parafrankia]MBE3199544.1 SDR family oxidoreductase [Parafrankia sp. CH37]CUU53791.1 dTDP-glucose 4,6-dehydratase [Parafrankia irregularis]
MRVVVTGGAGFVGSHLCDRLLELGDAVVCLDSLLTGKMANIAHLVDHPHFDFRCEDITAAIDVPGPVDAVLHFASPASPVDYQRFPLETLKVGALGTLNALEAAGRKGARFILASTSEVYGDPQVHPQPEEYWGNVNPIGPRSMYDEAKRYAEALVSAYRVAQDLDTAIVRIFNTYGPRMRPDDGRAIPTFVTQALTGQALTVTGDGTQTRSVCYVDDLVEGVIRVLAGTMAGPLNIGNPHEMSILDLARLVIEVCGVDLPITFTPRPGDDPLIRRPDITRARAELGWAPVVDIRDGLGRTIDWFRAELSEQRAEAAHMPHPRRSLDQPASSPQS